MCEWNSKYKVCYAEATETFTEIAIREAGEAEKIAEIIREEMGEGVHVVVVVDESGRTVIVVQGEGDVTEAVRKVTTSCGAGETWCSVVEGVKSVEAGAAGEGGDVSKAGFVAGVTVGGVAILGLAGAVATVAMQLVRAPAPPISPVTLG